MPTVQEQIAQVETALRQRFLPLVPRVEYPVQKFQSDSERKLSIIVDRESQKWFKPARGQFQIFYMFAGEQPEYQPDFVAETETVIYMLEPKEKGAMEDADVLAKKAAAVKWCKQASDYAGPMAANPGSTCSCLTMRSRRI